MRTYVRIGGIAWKRRPDADAAGTGPASMQNGNREDADADRA